MADASSSPGRACWTGPDDRQPSVAVLLRRVGNPKEGGYMRGDGLAGGEGGADRLAELIPVAVRGRAAGIAERGGPVPAGGPAAVAAALVAERGELVSEKQCSTPVSHSRRAAAELTAGRTGFE